MDRRLFLSGLAATLPSISLAETRPVLRNAANIIRAATAGTSRLDPVLAPITGYVLRDVTNGNIIDAYQPNLALPPASVTKAITAVYARHILGPGYKFTTRLMATGPLQNGVIEGDLYLVGGGDPALDTDELASLAAALVNAGIRGITGKFYVDSSALPDIAQIDPAQPTYLGYNPTISGLSLNFNRVYFEWKQAANGYQLSLDARTERLRPLVRGISISTENRGAPVFKYTNVNDHDRWSVATSALGSSGGRWLPVRHPADYVGEVFQTLALNAGLKLPPHHRKTAPVNATEVVRFDSHHLDEVLRWLLKYSNNLTAECLGLTASYGAGKRPGTLHDSASAMSRWVEQYLNVSGTEFHNHSGLTDRARVSALQMANMLASPISQQHLNGLLKPVALYDTSGKPFNNNGMNVFAKTGTLNFTRGLAGYLDKGQRRYSFAIFVANLDMRSNIPVAQMERPQGAKAWSNRAKRQEKSLLKHWIGLLG
ncbi:MAG: D-alanyl-D-alanine carboxypeptidase/D-alanyl-D-alanine-endopeptidase [Paracoccaceae bacterium]